MIDLHIHSNFSDGKDDIETLIQNVSEAGVEYFALTDHDTAKGVRTIYESEHLKKMIVEKGLSFVGGVEWSCLYKGKYKMHILAYDFDPYAPEVLSFEQEIDKILDKKREYREEFIRENGYILSEESKKYIKSKDNVRKLDYANCLINDGYFENVDDACIQLLNKCHYPYTERLDAEKLVKAMSKIGAKVVWAHPLGGLRERRITHEEVEMVSKELQPLGLCGLECFYSLYNKEEIDRLVQIAENIGFYATCGSDYHGKNKQVQLLERSVDGSETDESKVTIINDFKRIIKG